MPDHAVVIGSGAGGSVAAWVLAAAGWEVTVLEKGRNLFTGLGDPGGLGLPRFGNDEIRKARGLPGVDLLAEPRTSRTQAQAASGVARTKEGDINHLPATVGGGTTHWDAKCPRYWDIDFRMLDTYGPVRGAAMADWPFTYDDLAPYYDAVEAAVGIACDYDMVPNFVLEHQPRGAFQMPAGPAMYSSLVFREGARKLGYEPFPFMECVNSQPFDGRPKCVNCGFCSTFGCPNHSRGGAAVTFLHRAMLAGASLVPRTFATRVLTRPDGTASGVECLDVDLNTSVIDADAVVLAASAVESTRLALMSASSAHPGGLGNENDLVGRHLCFHADSFAAGLMPQRLHTYKGRSASDVMMEPCVPNRQIGRLFGLPFVRGGVVEIGGSTSLIEEAMLYDDFPLTRGRNHKNLMRESPLRDHLLGIQMIGEDLPQYANRIDLDPDVRDVYGRPVARATYTSHLHEKLASWYWSPKLATACRRAGAKHAYFLPTGIDPTSNGVAGNTRHISGTLRMGSDPSESVTDEFGRFHTAANVISADAATFPTSGAFNPTLTIWAVAMRNATALAHGDDQGASGPK